MMRFISLAALAMFLVQGLAGSEKPAGPADETRIARLVADLDSDQFAVRQKASDELEKLGEAVRPALEKALAAGPGPEAAQRVKQLLEKLDTTRRPRFDYKVDVKEVAVTPSFGKDDVLFRIVNEQGIGKADIVLAEGTWPASITLRLSGFTFLESFSVNNGDVRLSGRLRKGENVSEWYYHKDGRRLREEEDKSEAAFTLTVRSNGNEKAIDITLPKGFCTGKEKVLACQWIDAFRR